MWQRAITILFFAADKDYGGYHADLHLTLLYDLLPAETLA